MAGAILSGSSSTSRNILLVVAIDAAGMSVAFPLGVGLALVIGTVASFLQAPKGNPALLFARRRADHRGHDSIRYRL